MNAIRKVTAFVMRDSGPNPELLLFKHPHAGVQITAGTVNINESPEDAVLREVHEETGLVNSSIVKCLGIQDEQLPENTRFITNTTKVYARPDKSSFDWAYLRPGIVVKIERRAKDFCQIIYQEYDQVPHPAYETMVIKGWVPEGVLADTSHRSFYLINSLDATEDRWAHFADNHTFTLFWVSLNNIPKIISPQDTWLVFLAKAYPQLMQRSTE